MKKKLIGITPRIIVEGTVSKQFVNDTYMNAMSSLGFIPLMLPLDNNDIESLLDICDGFLVTGGEDITPSYFNQENQGSEGCDVRLDELDKMVVEYAYKHKKPMLGICRGHQSINVFLGGDLIQDIGKNHQSVRHEVITTDNRYFHFPKEMNVNSYHHQVVNKLAPGLIEIARSKEEGYNEAFIHESLPIISFQWHPEKVPTEESSIAIFNKFKELVENNK